MKIAYKNFSFIKKPLLKKELKKKAYQTTFLSSIKTLTKETSFFFF